MSRYCVYRYDDMNGEVAYIGQTKNLKSRMNQHKNDQLKGFDTSSIRWFPVSTRWDANAVESYLISHYKPRLNTAGVDCEITYLQIANKITWYPFTEYPGLQIPNFCISSLPKPIKSYSALYSEDSIEADLRALIESKQYARQVHLHKKENSINPVIRALYDIVICLVQQQEDALADALCYYINGLYDEYAESFACAGELNDQSSDIENFIQEFTMNNLW